MRTRLEISEDVAAVRSLTEAAFADVEHSRQSEGAIIDALRDAQALALSIVAEDAGVVIGHVAFSPVLINGRDMQWFGLGPVSVAPDRQGKGVGSALIRRGLGMLEDRRAHGCVVLGDPSYYARFGFTADGALRYSGAPPEYFQSRTLCGPPAQGDVRYHPAFEPPDPHPVWSVSCAGVESQGRWRLTFNPCSRPPSKALQSRCPG